MTREKQIALFQMSRTDGYGALLDIMEEECTRAETEHFQTQPEDERTIIAGHWTARAMRIFFERIQKRVQLEIQAGLQNDEVKEPPSRNSVEYITGIQG